MNRIFKLVVKSKYREVNVKYQITVNKRLPKNRQGKRIRSRKSVSWKDYMAFVFPETASVGKFKKAGLIALAEKLTLGINKTLFISIRALLKLKC